jgi:hypothetical protein
MTTNTLLLQLARLAEEASDALDSGGVPTLVLKTFSDAATPIWIQIGIAAKTANTPLAATLNKAANAPQPTGRFSGATQKTMPSPQPPVKNPPQVKPEAKVPVVAGTTPVPVSKVETPVSIPASKTATLNPARPRKTAGM